jgi:hypothetical protein
MKSVSEKASENSSFITQHSSFVLRWLAPIALGAGILAFLIVKSMAMQITHDESYTVEILSKQPIWDLITYKSSYTNNHILNTLLVKLLFFVFNSDHHALARVPNILAFIFYFYYCFRFSQRWISDNWVGLMFISVACCNPYLLDFFGLTRGYGLSIGLEMASIYFAARFVLDNHRKSLTISLLLSIFSVYAQFATLHFYLGLNLLIVLYLSHNYLKTKENNALIKGVLIQFLGFLLLALLIYLPIKAIIKNNEIAYYGKDGIWGSTLSSLINGSLYAQSYFKNDQTIPIFKSLTIALFFLLTAFLSFNVGNKSINKSEKTYPSVFATILFFSTCFSVVSQFYLLGNQYVVDRTALFFYPLLALLMPVIPLFFGQIQKQLSGFIAILFIVFSMYHIKRSHSFEYYREWWYDRHTYDVLDLMKTEYDNSDKKEPIKLTTNWLFCPSFTYHQKQKKADYIAPIIYHSQIDTSTVFDFYYTTQEEVPQLKSKYEVVKEWDYRQWVLLKRIKN